MPSLTDLLTEDQIEDLCYGLTLVMRIGHGRVAVVIDNGHPHLIEIAPTYRLPQNSSPRLKSIRRKALDALDVTE